MPRRSQIKRPHGNPVRFTWDVGGQASACSLGRPCGDVSFDETYLPRDLGEKIGENDLEAEPVFALLEGKYGTPLVEAEYKLEAAAADPVAAEALQVPAGSPIFLIERTSYTADNRPVDYERLHYRGDRIRFVTRLARRPGATMQR